MSFDYSKRALPAIAALLCVFVVSPFAHAYQGTGGNNNTAGLFGFGVGSVGGVTVNANNVLESAPAKISNLDLQRLMASVVSDHQAELQTTTPMRKVSLRGLYEAAEQAARDNKPLPAEVAFMAGLQRIEFVFVSPDHKDIILAGPAEGWKVDDAGNVVGITTGCPVMRLEDFLVALRTVDNARQDLGISCSINPTAEGAAALSKALSQMKAEDFSPDAVRHIEETGGPQIITFTGLPTGSRFAQVLVAADYKMKRLSMGFENAPIDGMPSYLEIAKRKDSARASTSPRFWMECNYLPLARSEDGLTWQLRGTGVKAMVEDGRIAADGQRVATGKANAMAEKWAETMTEKFDALAQKEPAFRELRNLMDMAVVAALISKESLLERSGLEIPLFVDATQLPTPVYNTPKTVPTQCSFVRLTGSMLVTASGGVQVDSWSVVEQTEIVNDLATTRSAALQSSAKQFWWN